MQSGNFLFLFSLSVLQILMKELKTLIIKKAK